MELTQEIVRDLLDYDPETGLLRWKKRDAKYFPETDKFTPEHRCAAFNAMWAGTLALDSINKGNGYKHGGIFQKNYKAHRIIWLYMTGEWPEYVDHINGNRSDNLWINLRNVNKLKNMQNTKRRYNNTSGCSGVQPKGKKWMAKVDYKKKRYYLGVFETYELAVEARLNKLKELGDFGPNHGS